MKAALELTRFVSFSIETDGPLWHFIRVGKIELFINGPDGAISTPWGDREWSFNHARFQKAVNGVCATVVAGSLALVAGGLSMLMDIAG